MAALTFMSHRFPWWPIHPAGFVVAMAWSVRTSAFSVLIAWLCKMLVLKIGGISLYRRSRLFFLGIIVGYACGLLLSLALDVVFFPGAGHRIYRGQLGPLALELCCLPASDTPFQLFSQDDTYLYAVLIIERKH